MKLKLTGAGFENYTGQMGVIYFIDGLSKHDVMPNDAIRIAGAIGAEWENGEPANLGEIYTQNLNTPAPNITQQSGLQLIQETVGHESLNADQAQMNVAQVVQEVPKNKEEQHTDNQESSKKYTLESLEKIADEQGISGLRAIGNEYGVKANSIASLIKEILQAQG